MSPLDWVYLDIGISILVILFIDAIRRFYNFRHFINQKTVLLELTPPAFTQKTQLATEHLLSVLHSLSGEVSWVERLLGRNSVYSFEVVSSRAKGIRYIIRQAESQVANFEQQLVAYLPDVRFQAVEDYLIPLINEENQINITEFRQAKHFAYPLASHDSLVQHDPDRL